MIQLDQRVSELPKDFGVELMHLDSERNFVDNALARTVAAAEQFEIFKPIVLPVSVDMVNGFFGVKVTPEMLGHDVAVFHNGVLLTCDKRRDGNPDVAVSLDVSPEIARVKTSQGAFSLVFDFAILAAKFLFSVNAPTVTARAVLDFTAFLTREFVSFVSRFAPAYNRAGHRAIQRRPSEFLQVGSQVRLHHGKGFVAFLATEIDGCATSGRCVVLKTLFTAAYLAAVFTAFFYLALVAVKGAFTTLTNHLDGHGYTPRLATMETVTMSFGHVK